MLTGAYILGIDTSCDDTSCAVVLNGREVLSDVVFSQDYLHRKYGGIVPEVASRNHLERLGECLDNALNTAKITLSDLSAVAVTNVPGLVGSLLTGLLFAKGLVFAAKKPLIAVNHLEGHICANYLDNRGLEPPFLCLVASGGHTSLYGVLSYTGYELLGETCDDAAGEAFDKTARALGLPYPGGAHIEKMAEGGSANAVPLPLCVKAADNFNFSFSGLKTAVIKFINDNPAASKADIAASFQNAVITALTAKTVACAMKRGFKTVAIAGGVAVNAALRAALERECAARNLNFAVPVPRYCADNGAMVAGRGYFDFIKNNFANLAINARSRANASLP